MPRPSHILIQFLVLWVLLLPTTTEVAAQCPLDGNTTVVNGFSSRISGQDFWYHSSIQIAKESMLVRAGDGTSTMEWLSDAVPSAVSSQNVSVVWLAGLGSSPGLASFELEVDGITSFVFWVDGKDEWLLKGEDSCSLWFRKDMIDQHGDRFGFMVLTMPARKLKAGQQLKLKVRGGNFNKTSWYMTFKFPIVSGLSIKAMPAIMNTTSGPRQLGIAAVMHFQPADTARIWIDGKLQLASPLQFGYNHLRLELPLVQDSSSIGYRLEVGGRIWEGALAVFPVRQWEVNLVQHSHTDIGYTRPQTEILGEHLRYIDYALDYCEATDSFPSEAQFRWTCEASWAVDEYLRTRPAAQVKRLLRRIGEGRIEVTGMYFNFDELPDEYTLHASLRPFRTFKKLGIEVSTAMQNDVNGIGWSLCEHFPELGVKYLNMGTHGHRALICFDKPTLFWWESPSGKRMLAYRAEHYMIGNTRFRIHSMDFDLFETELLAYLNDLQALGYNYPVIQLQHSGFITDNSPPSLAASEIVRMWNEKYSWPILRTATTNSFFARMERDFADSIPVFRAAWPDWWTDGFGASAREVAAVRKAQSELLAAGSGLTMAALSGSRPDASVSARISEAGEAQLFYTEHTVGYHASVREPFSINSMEQRALKESYAWEAARRSGLLLNEAMGRLQPCIGGSGEASVLLVNTMSWQRKALSRVYIDHQILPPYTQVSFRDQFGRAVPAQPTEKFPDGTWWALESDSLPAFGYKILKVDMGRPDQGASWPVTAVHATVFENQWYRMEIDPSKACISSLFDKDMGRELVDTAAEWGLGSFILELLDNREQLESFRLNNYSRKGLDSAWIESVSEGSLWTAVRLRGSTETASAEGAFMLEIRLFRNSKRIDLVYEIDKALNTEPEGIYIAMPFILPSGQLAFDLAGGEVRPGIDQIPGSSNDWNAVQNYARLYNADAQIVVATQDCPLMQFGAINTGRFSSRALPQSTHIYGWPMNNYWTTNYNAYQVGGHRWTYTITSMPGNVMADAVRFSWGVRSPVLATAVPASGNTSVERQSSFLNGLPSNLLLISAMPDPDASYAILHVREIEGKSASMEYLEGPDGRNLKVLRVDAAGEKLSGKDLNVAPFESAFFRIRL